MKKTLPVILAVLTAVILTFNGCKKQKPSPQQPSAEKPAAGKATDFKLKNYDGRVIKLSDYKGKIVVLEWFNYECPYVRYNYKDVHTMVDLANKYKDKNIVWLAVNTTKHLTVEKNRDFARKHNIPFPILDDRTGKVGHAYGATNTPHMFIVDTDGMVVYEGAIDNSPMGRKKDGVINYVDKALSELTEGKKVSTPKTDPYGCSVKYAD